MTKRKLVFGMFYTLACVLTLIIGGTAFAEHAPEIESETYLSINSNQLPLMQDDGKGGFEKGG